MVPTNKGTSPVYVGVGVYLYLRHVTPKTRKLAQVKNHLVIISGGRPSCLSKKTRKTAERSARFLGKQNSIGYQAEAETAI